MKKINKGHLQYRAPAVSVALLFIAGVFNIFNGNPYVAIAELVASVAIIATVVVMSRTRAKTMAEYISIMTGQTESITNELLSRFPLPMLVLSIDGKIVWYNNIALEIFNESDLFDLSIVDLIPELKWTQILKTTEQINIEIELNSRLYNLVGNIIKRNDDDSKQTYSVLLYFNDCTDMKNALRQREDEKTDVAVITIDNYDDLFQAMDDAKSRETLSRINAVISDWAAEANALIRKIQSDRYLVFFEHQYLDAYIKNKFDILEKVHAIGDDIKEPVTISIGIGTGGNIVENETYARNSVEVVWGRGGDQVAIKDNNQFKFYGGTTRDYEKSTRVKTRLFANALREMIMQADKVIFMGHKTADFDCFGSAVGLSRAVRLLNKPAYIVVDTIPSIKPMYDEMQKIPEYQGMIITPNDAAELVTSETLVIILDTHRPSMLPVPELLNKVNKTVLIDHHRRSAEFIENLSLTYLEPYASSTAELVTEILQYIDDKKQLSNFEAKALYVAILMDTKNFVTKTGVRTFEAASYLKRYGVNTMEVKRVFNLSFEEYIKRMDIVKKTEIWNSDIAVSVCSESFNNMRTISSQAADEMLNISGVRAAFVIYPYENEVFLSARSFGDFNVQVIMEKLGGGGHMTVAGCQIKNISCAEARNQLKDAIKEYIEENK